MQLRTLIDRYRQGQVDRRTFLAGATALGLSIPAATTILSSAAQAAPKRGGRLRIGMAHGGTTDSLDPTTISNDYTLVLALGGIHGYLTEIGPDGQLEPSLAEGWEPSADATQWMFKLRKGVEFHNGKIVDANDVVASINMHRGEDSTSGAKAIVDSISSIKTDGNDTVIFELSGGNADFPFIMSDFHLAIVPSEDGNPKWQAGIGAGSYELVDFDPGVRSLVKRNQNHWRSDRGFFDEVELLSIVDPTARQAALATGDVDVIDRVDPKTAQLLNKQTGVGVESITGTQHYTLPMWVDTPPFDDVHVRQAIKLSVDRKEILQKVLRGYGALGNDHPIAPSNRFHASDLPQREIDIEKAKWHLKQAGLTSVKATLSAADAAFAGAVDTAVLLKETAAGAGIDITVDRVPNDGYWSNVWLNKPWCACYWGGRPTEDWMFSTAYAADAAWNDTHWKNGRFNELLIEARSELDEAKRREMYFEMQQLVRDDGGAVVLAFADYIHAKSDKVQHTEVMAGNWTLDGGKIMERWWFA